MYVQRASRDKLPWKLTKPAFHALVSDTCTYCAAPPRARGAKKGRLGGFPWNGVDRLDNKKGYVPGNCISCCSECNYIRGRLLTHDEMMAVALVLKAIRKQWVRETDSGPAFLPP